MNWKPTEGAKRAGDLVCDLDRDAKANGWPIHYLMLVRMQDVIAKAIDQALADGVAEGAMTKATEPWGDFEHAGAFAGQTNTFTIGNGHANPDDYSELPVIQPDVPIVFDPVVEAREEGPGGGMRQIHGRTDGDTTVNIFVDEDAVGPRANTALKSLMQEPSVLDAPKKRRGRPPGSKGKKAKVKAAKAKKETAPVVVPDSTDVADLVGAPETTP